MPAGNSKHSGPEPGCLQATRGLGKPCPSLATPLLLLAISNEIDTMLNKSFGATVLPLMQHTHSLERLHLPQQNKNCSCYELSIFAAELATGKFSFCKKSSKGLVDLLKNTESWDSPELLKSFQELLFWKLLSLFTMGFETSEREKTTYFPFMESEKERIFPLIVLITDQCIHELKGIPYQASLVLSLLSKP